MDQLHGRLAQHSKPKRKRIRLEYNRIKQKEYRDRDKHEINQLKDHIQGLQFQYTKLLGRSQNSMKSTMLPWFEIVHALMDTMNQTLQEQRYLLAQRNQYRRMIEELHTMVQISLGISRSPTMPLFTWRNVTLMSNSESRRLALDWITLNLQHNAEVMFHRCHFPAYLTEDMHDCTVDTNDPDALQYILRYQRVVNASRQEVLEYIRSIDAKGQPIDPQLWPDTSEYFQYIQLKNGYDITREFHSKNRILIVSQNIHEDANLPVIPIQRNRVSWVLIDSLPCGKTCLRLLSIQSQHFDHDLGYLSLTDEAREWGCKATNPPLHTMIQHVTTIGNQYIQYKFDGGLN